MPVDASHVTLPEGSDSESHPWMAAPQLVDSRRAFAVACQNARRSILTRTWVALMGLVLAGVACSAESSSLAPADGTDQQSQEVAPGGVDSSPDSPAAPNDVPSVDDLVVEATLIDHYASQVGGNFYGIAAVIHNPTGSVAISVGGQLSVLSSSGDLVMSTNPTSVNILPGERGMLEEVLDLPDQLDGLTLDVMLSVSEWRDGSGIDSPVTFSNVRVVGDADDCEILGIVANTFTENKDNLQLRVGVYSGDDLLAADFTYVDQVFAGSDATFDVFMIRDQCLHGGGRVEVYPNLSEDKIFNQ